MNADPASLPESRAFSLVELVIVIVIIGVIAAIAVPRFSKATDAAIQNHAKTSAAMLQKAVDLFSAEHTTAGAWKYGGTEVKSKTVAQSLLFGTNSTGASGTDYGPYLRRLPPDLTQGEKFIGIAVDGACTGGNVGIQNWAATQCGWNLTLSTLTIN